MPNIGDTIKLEDLDKIPDIGQSVSIDQLSKYSDKPAVQPEKKSLLSRAANYVTSGVGDDIAAALGHFVGQKKREKITADDAKFLQTVIQKRRQAKDSGRDTTHWDSLLRNYSPSDSGATLEELYPELKKSNEQVIGDFASLLGTIVSAGGVGSVVKAPASGLLAGAKQGAIEGAKQGAISGGIFGAAGAMQDNQDSTGVARSALGGAAIGGAAGGAIGGVIGGIKGFRNPPPPTMQETIDTVAPKLTPKETREAITSGMAQKKGLAGHVSIDFSKDRDVVNAAESVKGIVSPKKTATENVNAVIKARNVVADDVSKFLTDNPKPFNFEDLIKKFDLVSPSDSLKSDTAAYETYNRIRKDLLGTIYNNLQKSGNKLSETDLNELWNSRKVIDKKIEEELGSAVFGSHQYTGAKAAARDFRTALNQFITDSLGNPGQMENVNMLEEFLKVSRSRGMKIPDENTALGILKKAFKLTSDETDAARAAYFQDSLKRMSNMYNAVDYMATKARSEINTTAVDRGFNALKKHPVVSALGSATAGAAIYQGARSLFFGGGGDGSN